MQSLCKRSFSRLPACGILLAAAALVGAQAQPGKAAVAKVTITGKEVGAITVDDGSKKERFILVELDERTTIKVRSSQEVAKFNEEMLAQHRAMTTAFTDDVKKLIQQNDFQGLKKAEAAFKLASDELLKHLSFVAAEGTIVQAGAELQLDGKVRLFAYRGSDKNLGKGKAFVEGEATHVQYDAGKGAKMTLAIQNGSGAIVVLGRQGAGEGDNGIKAKSTIRALGVLRSGAGGVPVLEAEKIEVVK